MHKLLLILHTIRFLKPIQIRYQLWYRIRLIWRKRIRFNYSLTIKSEGVPLSLIPVVPKNTSFNQYQFTFLNQSTTFPENNIDWNYPKFGKLWTYNLNYFDFLLQTGLNKETGTALINEFISKLQNHSTALEPYPIALRGINWIKFVSRFQIQDSGFNDSLYAQYQILLNNLEYHLLGNHLLEDGFSLLFGAFYFKDKNLYNKARLIIIAELKEQILDDGGHFELSPMYHQIILDRLLDCLNLVKNNRQFEDQKSLLTFMNEKAVKMLKWLNCMTFTDGHIPLLNDSAPGIAASTDQLNQYALRLGILDESVVREIRENPCNLSHSGYRRFRNNNFECTIDVGQIGPSYQPGHAHADTFSFVLNVRKQAYLIDSGISTYEANQTRLKERGTASHNTVTIGNENSSAIWSSFRVAHRAKVKILKENNNTILAEHDGFRLHKTTHQRKWEFQENKIQITDQLNGNSKEGKAHFWLDPQLTPECINNAIHLKDVIFTFDNADSVMVIKTQIPSGYNKLTDCYKLEISFKDHLTSILTIN